MLSINKLNYPNIPYSRQTLPPCNEKPTLSFQQQPTVQNTLPQVGQRYSFQHLNDAINYEVCDIVLDGDNNYQYLIKYDEEGGNMLHEEEIGIEAMLDMLSSSVLLDL